jgi:hypothetical protein
MHNSGWLLSLSLAVAAQSALPDQPPAKATQNP